MVLDLANDKATAALRLAALRERYNQLAGKARWPRLEFITTLWNITKDTSNDSHLVSSCDKSCFCLNKHL